MKLEWRKIPARFRFADCEFGQYRIAGRAGIRRKLHIELCDGRTLDDDRIIHDVPTARQICQDDYDARVAEIAAANGYVKVSADEIILPRDMARELIEDRCGACEDEGLSDCDNCDLKPIRGMLKSEVGK